MNNINSTIKAVIFDMDGFMVDSEIYWPEAEKYIWSELGVDFTDMGVIAGSLSGAYSTMTVLNKRWSRGDFSKSDLIVSSLEDTRVYDFLNL